MDGCWVAKTVEFNHLASFVNSVFTAFRFQNSDDWWQFFTSQRLFFTNFFTFCSKDIGSFWDWEASLFSDPCCWFPNDVRIQFRTRTVFAVGFYTKAELFKKGFFFFVNEVSVVRFEFFNKLIVDFFIDDDRLLRCTDHSVVKWFRHDDIVGCLADVGWFFNISRYVSGTNPKSWFSTRVGRFHHGVPTGREDRSNSLVVHQGTRCFHRRLGNPLHTVLRCSSCNCCIAYDLCCMSRWFLSRWVEGKDDRVPCLQGNQCFKDCCWSRVGCRCDPADNTDWLSNKGQTSDVIFWNDPNCLGVTHVIYYVFTSEQVLRRLVFKDSTTSFFISMKSELTVSVKSRYRCFRHNVVHLLLIQFAHLFKRHQRFLHQLVYVFFSSEFLFFRWESFFISHLMLSSNVWNPYPFPELFLVFRNFQE